MNQLQYDFRELGTKLKIIRNLKLYHSCKQIKHKLNQTVIKIWANSNT